MTFTTRTESVRTPDGDFDLHLWVPDGGRGPGILLLQEIFGVGIYLRGVAERLVARGYVVGAPDVFWRLQRNWEAEHDEAGLAASLDLAGRFDFEQGVADCVTALRHLAATPEVTGGVGVLGFCLGGTLAYHVAVQGEPAAVVSYYGSGVAAGLDLAEHITCPIQFHFGEADTYIPVEHAEAVALAMTGREHAEVHVQPGAGHAFDNFAAPMFHQPAAAEASWALTMGFFERHLPTN